MAETLKVLGQQQPASATLTTLYTVPGATSAAVSTIICCNQGGSDAKVRVSIAVAGAADTGKQYLYYDVIVPGNDSLSLTIGATLATTDLIRVQSDNGNVSFNAFGVEVT